MGKIDANQSQAVMATLMHNVSWDKIDFEETGLQDSVLRDPKGAGERFTAFLNNGCRLVVTPTETPSVPEGQKWTERDGVIYFTLPSTDGRTGKQWKKSLKSQGKRFSNVAEAVLDSDDFVPTTGVVYKVAIIRGTFWKKDNKRLIKNIEAEGVSRGWVKLQPEAVCLIREYFSDEELGVMDLLYILGIHKPIEARGGPLFLCSNRHGKGGWLDTDWANPDSNWSDGGAFAFGLPQENQT